MVQGQLDSYRLKNQPPTSHRTQKSTQNRSCLHVRAKTIKILENVRISSPNKTIDDVYKATKMAHVHSDILNFDKAQCICFSCVSYTAGVLCKKLMPRSKSQRLFSSFLLRILQF